MEDKRAERDRIDRERLLAEAKALGCEEHAKIILETRGIEHAKEHVKKIAAEAGKN